MKTWLKNPADKTQFRVSNCQNSSERSPKLLIRRNPVMFETSITNRFRDQTHKKSELVYYFRINKLTNSNPPSK